jgi:hypothetical protein
MRNGRRTIGLLVSGIMDNFTEALCRGAVEACHDNNVDLIVFPGKYLDREALDIAYSLFDVIETKCRDEGGYLEAFTRDFCPASNEKLSENGVEATRTMNTLLHVFEAYTELYRVDKKDKVAEKLKEILDIFADKIYNPNLGRLEVFFDKDYRSLLDLYSYGHDIETAWLIDRGLEVLKDDPYTNQISHTAFIEVLSHQNIPKGMNAYHIAPSRYLVFSHKGPVQEITNTYHYIYHDWLPNSDYELSKTGKDLQIYMNDKVDGLIVDMDICVPIE